MIESAALPGGDLAAVRQREQAATQWLLGDTISISEDAWHEPVALPGWTRANVAAHLARSADGLRRLVDGILSGVPARMYDSDASRNRDIARGEDLDALEIQIDLDTSAMRLNQAFDALTEDQWDAPVATGTGLLPARLLPLLRLNEVVLHHVDLDCGFTLSDLDPIAARWLLEWNCFRMARRVFSPAIRVQGESGFVARLGGSEGEVVDVRASDAHLVGWLTGRLDRAAVQGAEHLSLGTRA